MTYRITLYVTSMNSQNPIHIEIGRIFANTLEEAKPKAIEYAKRVSGHTAPKNSDWVETNGIYTIKYDNPTYQCFRYYTIKIKEQPC